jgi:hypothetical protein
MELEMALLAFNFSLTGAPGTSMAYSDDHFDCKPRSLLHVFSDRCSTKKKFSFRFIASWSGKIRMSDLGIKVKVLKNTGLLAVRGAD